MVEIRRSCPGRVSGLMRGGRFIWICNRVCLRVRSDVLKCLNFFGDVFVEFAFRVNLSTQQHMHVEANNIGTEFDQQHSYEAMQAECFSHDDFSEDQK